MEPPPEPSESDCCNSGCNPCILDVYEEQLRRYRNKTLLATSAISKRNCISPTTYTYVKQSNQSNDQLVLIYKPGQHFLLKGRMTCDKNDQFTRAYTPIPVNNNGPLCFTIVVKHYKDGRMSQFLKQLKVNSETVWRGPYGLYEISLKFEFVLLIAQGTGIAPLYAVLREMLDNLECETFLKLFFCCRTESDILLRNELYELCSFWNFTYEIFLSSCDDIKCKYNERIHSTRLNHDAIKRYVEDKKDRSIQVLICGSEVFNSSMSPVVTDCGICNSQIFLF